MLKGGNQKESLKEEKSSKKDRKEEKEISSLHPQKPNSLGWGRNSPAPSSAALYIITLNCMEKFKQNL